MINTNQAFQGFVSSQHFFHTRSICFLFFLCCTLNFYSSHREENLISCIELKKDLTEPYKSTEYYGRMKDCIEQLLESFSVHPSPSTKIKVNAQHITIVAPLIKEFTILAYWAYAHTAWTCFSLMLDLASTEVIQEIAPNVSDEILEELQLVVQTYKELPPVSLPLQFAFFVKDICIFLLNVSDKALLEDIKFTIILNNLLETSSNGKAKSKKSSPFQTSYWNFIRALLCFCSVRFPISYARLKGFSSYQQDFFGQYMIHTARCASETLSILHSYMLKNYSVKSVKLDTTFSRHCIFKNDLQRYFQCLLHCPDGLLQTLLTEYLCHYITLHPNLWDRLKDSLRNFETFVNNVDVKDFEMTFKKALTIWNVTYNSMKFLSELPTVMTSCFDGNVLNETHQGSSGYLEINEFALLFETQSSNHPFFIEIPYWACDKPIDVSLTSLQINNTPLVGHIKIIFTVAMLKWISKNWVGYTFTEQENNFCLDTSKEVSLDFEIQEADVTNVLEYLQRLSKKNHLKLNSAQIASCLQDCSDTIQQKTSPKPSQVTCSAEESQQKSYSHPCTLEEEAVYVSQQNPCDTLSSKPSNPLAIVAMQTKPLSRSSTVRVSMMSQENSIENSITWPSDHHLLELSQVSTVAPFTPFTKNKPLQTLQQKAIGLLDRTTIERLPLERQNILPLLNKPEWTSKDITYCNNEALENGQEDVSVKITSHISSPVKTLEKVSLYNKSSRKSGPSSNEQSNSKGRLNECSLFKNKISCESTNVNDSCTDSYDLPSAHSSDSLCAYSPVKGYKRLLTHHLYSKKMLSKVLGKNMKGINKNSQSKKYIYETSKLFKGISRHILYQTMRFVENLLTSYLPLTLLFSKKNIPSIHTCVINKKIKKYHSPQNIDIYRDYKRSKRESKAETFESSDYM